MSESEPIPFRPRHAGGEISSHQGRSKSEISSHQGRSKRRDARALIAFNREELDAILAVYGRKVAAGEWRDYAIDIQSDKAIFSIYRRSSEWPLYRIEKSPPLARRQGAYSVMAPAGLILKRGDDLKRVLGVLEGGIRIVEQGI